MFYVTNNILNCNLYLYIVLTEAKSYAGYPQKVLHVQLAAASMLHSARLIKKLIELKNRLCDFILFRFSLFMVALSMMKK